MKEMIKKENRGRFTKKNFNYINSRLKYIRQIIERDLRQSAKKYKDKDLRELTQILSDIRSEIYWEIKGVMQGGLKDLED